MRSTFRYYKPIFCCSLALFAFIFLAGCSKTTNNEPDEDEVLVFGPVKIDQNAKDVGVKKNPSKFIIKHQDIELPDFIEEDEKLRNRIREEIDSNKVDRYAPEANFSAKNYAFLQEFEPTKRVMFCEDFPRKKAAAAKENSGYYRTDCDGIEHFTDGNEGSTGTINDEYIYNNPRLMYITRTAYYLGDSAVQGTVWTDIKNLYPGFSNNRHYSTIEPVDKNMAVVTFQDWGYYYHNLIDDSFQKNYNSKKYGENRIYSPREGVLVYETQFDMDELTYEHIKKTEHEYYPPKKYYGFIVSINNRISFSGHTEVGMNSDATGKFITNYDYSSFDKKVKFYKDYIKNLDYDKLSGLSKAEWQ